MPIDGTSQIETIRNKGVQWEDGPRKEKTVHMDYLNCQTIDYS